MSPSPKTVVVTGANRGIGLTIVKELVKDKNIKTIIASVRDVKNASDIPKDPRVHILPLSVTSDESIDSFVAKVGKIVGDDGLNLLINNAGVMKPYETNGTPCRSILTEQFDVNTISVVLLTQKLLSLLRQASFKQNGDKLSISRSAIINISSGLASIAGNVYGSIPTLPVLAYAMSKTAINQFTKILSLDLKSDGILAVCFEPGWIQTDMGGPNAPLTLNVAIPVLVKSFYKLDNTHHGGFFERNLVPIPY